MTTSAVSATAETAAATAAGAAAATSSAAASTARATSAVAAPIRAAISTAFRTTISADRGVAVEVGFVVGEVGAAFDGQGCCASRFAADVGAATIGRDLATPHFGALFLEDGFTRQTDAVAFNGQNLDQHLVAFFQLVANVFDAMFGDFTDVQQAVGARNDLHESAEIRQAGDGAQVSLPDLGGSREVPDDLQGLGRRGFIVRGYVNLA